MHDDIRKLYGQALNTVRIMAVNEHGDDPLIAAGIFRIGTAESGLVDNVSSGGICCALDLGNGHYSRAFQRVSGESVVYHDAHPDTKEPLDGYIPHWDMIKDTIIKICLYIPDLEYMGLDVAVTRDGFKILEINSHQTLFPYCFLYNNESEKLRGYFSRLLGRKGIKPLNGFYAGD